MAELLGGSNIAFAKSRLYAARNCSDGSVDDVSLRKRPSAERSPHGWGPVGITRGGAGDCARKERRGNNCDAEPMLAHAAERQQEPDR